MTLQAETTNWRPFVCSSNDGIRIVARDYRPLQAPVGLPLVCLPGLTRNGADFDALATRFSSDPSVPRRVLAIDFRGRGLSDRDPDWSHYAPPVEMEDVCTVLDAAGITRCHALGTSRGGIVGMMLAALDPARIASLVLNDLGPVIECAGMRRIAAVLRAPHLPATWQETAAALHASYRTMFPTMTFEDWMRFARQTHHEENGRPVLSYDPALGQTLDALDLDDARTVLWPLFETLEEVPVLAIRGENSDILSAETFAEMQARRPDMTAVTSPHEGHAPLLWDGPAPEAIKAFLARWDGLPD